MSMPDRVAPDPELPEQHLLRRGERLRDYASAFVLGEITAVQYSELVMAEIGRRGDGDDLLAWSVRPPRDAVAPLVVAPPVVQVRAHPQGAVGRSIVLARAFVGGQIGSIDFLRLIRDC